MSLSLFQFKENDDGERILALKPAFPKQPLGATIGSKQYVIIDGRYIAVQRERIKRADDRLLISELSGVEVKRTSTVFDIGNITFKSSNNSITWEDVAHPVAIRDLVMDKIRVNPELAKCLRHNEGEIGPNEVPYDMSQEFNLRAWGSSTAEIKMPDISIEETWHQMTAMFRTDFKRGNFSLIGDHNCTVQYDGLKAVSVKNPDGELAEGDIFRYHSGISTSHAVYVRITEASPHRNLTFTETPGGLEYREHGWEGRLMAYKIRTSMHIEPGEGDQGSRVHLRNKLYEDSHRTALDYLRSGVTGVINLIPGAGDYSVLRMYNALRFGPMSNDEKKERVTINEEPWFYRY